MSDAGPRAQPGWPADERPEQPGGSPHAAEPGRPGEPDESEVLAAGSDGPSRLHGSPSTAVFLRHGVTVLAVFVVAGLVAGLVWSRLVDPVLATRSAEGVGIGESDLARQFSADGWFLVVGAVGGLVLGAALTAWRSPDVLVTLLLVAAGAMVASAVAAVTGHLVGPGDPTAALADAAVGATAATPLRVHADAVYLSWPFAAVVGCLLVLLSPLRLAGEGADARGGARRESDGEA